MKSLHEQTTNKLTDTQIDNIKGTLKAYQGFLAKHSSYSDKDVFIEAHSEDYQKPIVVINKESQQEQCYLDYLGNLHYVTHDVISYDTLGVLMRLSAWLHAHISNVLAWKET